MALQLEELKSCFTRTPEDVREALQTLPKTLKETYDKILNSIPRRNQSYIRAVIQWIACSAIPLSLDELAVAAVNDPAAAKFYGSKYQPTGGGENIEKMLFKLIDVRKAERVSVMDLFEGGPKPRWTEVFNNFERAKEQVWYYGSDIVTFSHSSVRDYLLQRHDDADVSRSFSFSENMAHRFIAKSCLAFFQNITTPSAGDKACGEGFFCLFTYLGRHWHTHAACLRDEEPGSLAHLLNEVPFAVNCLLSARDEYTEESFAEIVGWEGSHGERPSPELILRYVACRGSTCVLDSFLASNPDLDVNGSTEYGDTALSLACERQHWQIADTLLKRGADPNKNSESIAPIVDASMHGADDIVQKLISHGANVNVECGTFSHDTPNTPLSAAIAASHLSTIELLLINGANPEIISNLGNAISVAASLGRHECVDLLLKYGATLEVSELHSSSLLELASTTGSIETVKLLLIQGLDVDDKNRLVPLAEDAMLPANTYTFNYPTIDISQPRPHTSFCDDSYGSPMHAAAADGHTEIIKLLVDQYSAAVNEKSHY